MNYRIAICDDNKEYREYIQKLVMSWEKQSKNKVNISKYSSAESFLFHYSEDKDLDILLLDIEMEGLSGIELAKIIRKDNPSLQIVFITGYTEFVYEGYEVSALHYLIKPLHQDKLFQVLNKAVDKLEKKEKVIIITIEGEVHRILERDILLIEAFGHMCNIVTEYKNYSLKSSISELEQKLSQDFIRCHRSYIVGIKHMKKIIKTEVTLDNDRKVPISRSKYDNVNQAFILYYRGESYETF